MPTLLPHRISHCLPHAVPKLVPKLVPDIDALVFVVVTTACSMLVLAL